MARGDKGLPEPFSLMSASGMSAASLQPAAPCPLTLRVSNTDPPSPPNQELTMSLGLKGLGSFQRVVYTRAL